MNQTCKPFVLGFSRYIPKQAVIQENSLLCFNKSMYQNLTQTEHLKGQQYSILLSRTQNLQTSIETFLLSTVNVISLFQLTYVYNFKHQV